MSEPTAHAPRVTLDHNCVIALEHDDGHDAEYLRRLIAFHDKQAIQLRVAGIGASEALHGGIYAATFDQFQQKLRAAGLAGADILRPIGKWDITFWDWCVLSDDTMAQFERDIQAVLFPDVSFDYPTYCVARGISTSDPLDRTWRNAQCDVATMWCHILYGGDIFVTNDRNFHKATKKPKLIALGAGAILRPAEAVHAAETSSKVSGMEAR